jgi:protein involved in polysaccharide export with SLBB domain
MKEEKSHSATRGTDFRKSMKLSKGWSSWKFKRQRGDRGRWGLSHFGAYVGSLVVFFFFETGCAIQEQQRARIEKTLMNDRDVGIRHLGVLENYQIGCPDVLLIDIADNSPRVLSKTVGPDGRIDMGAFGKLRVEGRSPVQIEALIAEELVLAPGLIQVRVAKYRSQQLFLFGQVVGWQRSVPYQGQETVLDLLQRIGGITSGAEPNDVYVVRAHIAEGGRPEVFHIDLQAIVEHHDQKTNLRLMPNDQIYVGETRQASIERIIPPWVRPFYQAFWNTQPLSQP